MLPALEGVALVRCAGSIPVGSTFIIVDPMEKACCREARVEHVWQFGGALPVDPVIMQAAQGLEQNCWLRVLAIFFMSAS